MTNYLPGLAAALAFAAGACPAADATKPAASLPRYVQTPTGSSLRFTFDQEGAASTGSFKKFATELAYDESSPAGSLDVKIEMASVDTQDKDRDDTLKSADLFDAQKFPTARYVASEFAKSPDGGTVAVGKLTLRGVTRELRLPLNIVRTAAGLTLSGETVIKRLDYGVGQGEWQATGSVGDQVRIQYKVSLAGAK